MSDTKKRAGFVEELKRSIMGVAPADLEGPFLAQESKTPQPKLAESRCLGRTYPCARTPNNNASSAGAIGLKTPFSAAWKAVRAIGEYDVRRTR